MGFLMEEEALTGFVACCLSWKKRSFGLQTAVLEVTSESDYDKAIAA
jgi:hypothetical protein